MWFIVMAMTQDGGIVDDPGWMMDAVKGLRRRDLVGWLSGRMGMEWLVNIGAKKKPRQ